MFLILLSMEIDSSHIGPNRAHENTKALFHDRNDHVLDAPGERALFNTPLIYSRK
jgi:hypothetical protein